MGVFTFVCRSSGNEWTAKQFEGELEASASSTFDLQRKLVQTAFSADSSGGVQSSFSYVTPTSAVFPVVIGAAGGGSAFVGGGGAFVGGGGGAAASSSAGGAPAAQAPPAEEKKEEKEESDDDMGFSLFD